MMTLKTISHILNHVCVPFIFIFTSTQILQAGRINSGSYIDVDTIVSYSSLSTALAYNVTIFDVLDTKFSPGFIPRSPTTSITTISSGSLLITNVSIPVLNSK